MISLPKEVIKSLPVPSSRRLWPPPALIVSSPPPEARTLSLPLPVLIDQSPLSPRGMLMTLLPPPATTVPEPPVAMKSRFPVLDSTVSSLSPEPKTIEFGAVSTNAL